MFELVEEAEETLLSACSCTVCGAVNRVAGTKEHYDVRVSSCQAAPARFGQVISESQVMGLCGVWLH